MYIAQKIQTATEQIKKGYSQDLLKQTVESSQGYAQNENLTNIFLLSNILFSHG